MSDQPPYISRTRAIDPGHPEEGTISYDYYGTSPTGYVQFTDDSASIVTFDADDLDTIIEILTEFKATHATRPRPAF